MTGLFDDKAVVEAFVSHLSENVYPNLKVDWRPDDENRDSSDIDAIAGSLAIEHTSVDTITNQRRDSDWFLQAVGGLESELRHEMNYRLNVTIPYEAVQVGQDWKRIRDAFKAWIRNKSSRLVDGVHIIRNEGGIPFDFQVRKKSGREPGLFFGRFAPEDNSLPDRIRSQLLRKAQKLEPYKTQGYTTILLVESNDIALMNEDIMLDSIRHGFSNRLPFGVDQMWYVDTAIGDNLQFHDFTESVQKYRYIK